MAQAKTLRFAQQSLLLGGPAAIGTYEAPCGFIELGLTVNIETNSTNVPDCDDPDLPAWLVSDEVSKQMVLNGTGVLDTDALQVWRDWLLEGGERYVRWMTDGVAADGGGYFQAPGILSTYEEGGQRGQRWSLTTGITLNGKPEWVPTP